MTEQVRVGTALGLLDRSAARRELEALRRWAVENGLAPGHDAGRSW